MKKWMVMLSRILLVSFSLLSFNQKVLPMLSSLEVGGQNYDFCKSNPFKESDIYIQDLTIDSWVKTPLALDKFLMILQTFNENMADWLTTDTLWVESKCPEGKVDNIFIKKDDIKYFTLPYVGKWVLPENAKILTIGDQHGVFTTTASLLTNLKNNNFINDKMKLRDDVRLVFLGDYTDRGSESIKVLTTAVLLALKNPGKVMLLRGNHENIKSNIADANFMRELLMVDPEFKNYEKIIGEIKNLYEYLPCAMLIGFRGPSITKFKLFSHAGLEIRFSFCSILDYNAVKLSRNGGIYLKEIVDDDLYDEEVLGVFVEDFLDEFKIKDFEVEDFFAIAEESFEAPAYWGFIWNDVDGVACISPGGRGKGAVSFSYRFIKYMLESMGTLHAKIDGIVRGHQHTLPKEVYCRNLNLNYAYEITQQITPSCCVMTSDYKNNNLLSNLRMFSRNIFTITTLVSGPIFFSDGSCLNYAPTFISLEFKNGNWIYNSYCS